MKTADIYKKYNLMPQLIKHQLRVAAVAKLISEGWDDRKAAKAGVRACLLHDMGNMAKFTGLNEYWSQEQKKFWDSWGHDAHEATCKIIEELGMSEYVAILEEEVAYYRGEGSKKPFAETGKPALMLLYSDLRVGMGGVMTMYERIKDLIARYPGSNRPETVWGEELERYVQVLTPVKLSEITEERVKPLFDELLSLEW